MPADASSTLWRDQQRALHAYEAVAAVPQNGRKDYEIAVNDLGANVLRSGLSAALASLERQKGKRGNLLLEHLSAAKIPGLSGVKGEALPEHVRNLDVDSYMLATRETLRVAAWLKRAAQATFGDS